MLFQTPIGLHDGDSWERLCQVCLKSKYSGSYIEVPASPGDYGLDGFTTDGEAFQCYCPERECTDSELHESQRDKVTKDIGKLKKNEAKLALLLNGIKLKRWYLLTPKLRTNDLIFHCNKKVDLVKSWNLPFIDDDFRVIPLNVEYIYNQIPAALSMLNYTAKPSDIIKRIELKGTSIQNADIERYKTDLKNSSHTSNAYRKHSARYYNQNGIDYGPRIVQQVDRTVNNLLIGDSILKEWDVLYQDQLNKFYEVVDILERNVSDLCDVPTNDAQLRYQEIQNLAKNTIDKEFSTLSETTRMNLSMRVIADWILRCPLNFE